jgi:hypothetical protein
MWKVYFNLNEPSPLEANSEINGVKVNINQRSKHLVVENIAASDETDAQQKALTIANRFLDALCWRFGNTLAIDTATRGVERIDSTGQNRFITVSDSGRGTEHFRLEKKDSSGNIIEVIDSRKRGKKKLNHPKLPAITGMLN